MTKELLASDSIVVDTVQTLEVMFNINTTNTSLVKIITLVSDAILDGESGTVTAFENDNDSISIKKNDEFIDNEELSKLVSNVNVESPDVVETIFMVFLMVGLKNEHYGEYNVGDNVIKLVKEK